MRKLISIIFSIILIFGLCTFGFADYTDYKKGPYLQNVTKTSIEIYVQLGNEDLSTVRYCSGLQEGKETCNSIFLL